MLKVRCISNCVIQETGRPGEAFASRWVPLTVGEVYFVMPGPLKQHHRFILDDEQDVRQYPDYLFEVIG